MTRLVVILLALYLIPVPTLPTPIREVATRQEPSTRIGVDLIFGITFFFALFLALLGSFAWFATGRTVAEFFAVLNRMCSTSIAFCQRLSEFRFSSLIERAAATILNATDTGTANAPRRGGPSSPVATERVQNGSGRFGGGQGGGILPTSAPST